MLGIYLVMAVLEAVIFGRRLSFRLFVPDAGKVGEPVPGELVITNESWLPVSCVRAVLYAENNPGDWEAEKKRDTALFSKGQKSWLFSLENGAPGAVRLNLDRLEVSDPLGLITKKTDISDVMLGKNRTKYLAIKGKKPAKDKNYLKLSNRTGGPATKGNTAFSGFLGRVVAALLVGASTFLMINEMLELGWSPLDALGAKFLCRETLYILGIAAVCFLIEISHVYPALFLFAIPEVLSLLSIFTGEIHPLTVVMHVVALIVAFCGARSEEVSVSGYLHGLIIAGIMLIFTLG